MNDRVNYSIVVLKERLLAVAFFRMMFQAWSMLKAAWYRALNNEFEAADATLYYSRILSVGRPDKALPVSPLIRRINSSIIERCVRSAPRNHLLEAYAETKEATECRREFAELGLEWARALKHPRKNDSSEREGDLLVLKEWLGDNERGVLLVQYNGSIRRFAALYDVSALAEHYRFVLEPSWWGYEDATLLMYLGLPTDAIVQAQFSPDYEYIRQLGHNIHPIHLGAGDWVDPETFSYDPTLEKRYDIIMIANWQRLKRHELLFRALRPIADNIGRVALVGYEIAGRTIDDIKREASKHRVLHLLDFYEKIPFNQVSQLLQQSRVCAMLTRREGANRAIYEALFSNTPVLLCQGNVGVNREIVNGQTGLLSRDHQLSENLLRLVRDSGRYRPRAWALANTGYHNSTRRLNTLLKDLATTKQEPWTRDIYVKKNRPNSMFARDAERQAARRHLTTLGAFLRESTRPSVPNPTAHGNWPQLSSEGNGK